MTSSRTRFTLSTVVILLGTMVAFALLLGVERRAVAIDQLTSDAEVMADSIIASIAEAQQTSHTLTTMNLTSFGGATWHATLEMGMLLDPKPGYFLVIGDKGQVLYTSTLTRELPEHELDALMRDTLINVGRPRTVSLTDSAGGADSIDRARAGPAAATPTRPLMLRAVARRSPDLGTGIDRVIFALPTYDADLAAQLLLQDMVWIAPVVILLAILAAYFVTGLEASPVELLINEVEAISDGRSLHRRLPAETSSDELSRLSGTLNAMLSRLEHSFSALRRFTADASHELKTPLAVLRADVERSMHPKTTRGERMVALEEALHEIARMSDLVDSLLTLARADEGRFDLHQEPLHLEPLVRDVFETAMILGEGAGLAIVLPSVDDAVVLGDAGRLRHLLLNLVTNAIKYTPSGGRVEIAMTNRDGSEVAITVRDSGIGIAAADLPHVFDRFWRADRVRSRASERGGFGLGLAISQWIVQAHGGSVSVESRLGRGTTFTVVLPALVSDRSAAAGPDSAGGYQAGVAAEAGPHSEFTDS